MPAVSGPATMRMIMAIVAAPAISAPDMPATFSIQTGR
jgi:hypothetical protein